MGQQLLPTASTDAKSCSQNLGFVQGQMQTGMNSIALAKTVAAAENLVVSLPNQSNQSIDITDPTALGEIASYLNSNNASLNIQYLALLNALITYLQSVVSAVGVLG